MPHTQVRNHEGFIANHSRALEMEATQAVKMHALKTHGSLSDMQGFFPENLETDICFSAGECTFVGEVKELLDADASKQLDARISYAKCVPSIITRLR